MGIDDDAVRLDCGGKEATVPFAAIQDASLVMTDDLIEAAQREAENAVLSEN